MPINVFEDLDCTIRHMPMERESAGTYFILCPLRALVQGLRKVWRHITGAWYCEYCKTYHSGRYVPYAILCHNTYICSRGVAALESGIWSPNHFSELNDLVTRGKSSSGTWSPRLWFACDSSKNYICKKSACGDDQCCRTPHIEFSTDSKILWPDSHHCDSCPLDPCTCQSAFTSVAPPCETTATYSDYVRLKDE